MKYIACKDCQERTEGCHGVCERYQAEVRIAAEEKKKRAAEADLEQYRYDIMNKAIREHRRRRL